MLTPFLILFVSFAVLWVSSGVTVASTENLSKRLRISPFLTSFFTLGLLTSLSEISVAFFSTIEGTPSVSVGNLLGASAVLTLLLIPLQVVISKGITVSKKTDQINLPAAYMVISLPVLLLLDGSLGRIDALIMLFSYVYLLFTISNKQTLFAKIEQNLYHPKSLVILDIFKIFVGAGIVVIASKFILDSLILIANTFNIPSFAIGLIVLSIGTNIPEISVLIHSYIINKKNLALGDYIGSASLNTAILSFLVFANNSVITVEKGLKFNILLLPFGALLFLLFVRNKRFETKEAKILMLCYVAFVVLELVL